MSNALCKGCGNISGAASRENYNFSFTGFRVFPPPPLSFRCVISLSCNRGDDLRSGGKDELGLAGVVKVSPSLGTHCSAWTSRPQNPPRWAPVGRRSSVRTPLACLGTGKTHGAGLRGPKAGLRAAGGWGLVVPQGGRRRGTCGAHEEGAGDMGPPHPVSPGAQSEGEGSGWDEAERAWSGGSLILAQAQSKGIYF